MSNPLLLSFLITKYDLTVERYIDLLDEGVPWSGPLGYGTYMSRYEPATFLDSYDDWVCQEIYIIEETELTNPHGYFQIVKKETQNEHKRI